MTNLNNVEPMRRMMNDYSQANFIDDNLRLYL